MPSKSKTKGSAWERNVAKFLTETYEEPFIRIPTSGAFTGGKNSFRMNNMQEGQILSRRGDIQPPDDWKFFNCEAKSYADFRFHQLFTGDNKVLDEWIIQTLDVAYDHDFNIILMKFNNKGTWVAFESKHGIFNVDRSIRYKDWIFCSWDSFWTPNHICYVKNLCINGAK